MATTVLLPGAVAAIRYSIALIGRSPTDTELSQWASAYGNPASATVGQDAVAAAVAKSDSAIALLRPNVLGASEQARLMLRNVAITDNDVVAYVAGLLDGTNADGGKIVYSLGTVARVVSNFLTTWMDTPANKYNGVLNAGRDAIKAAENGAIDAIVSQANTFKLTAGIDKAVGTIFVADPVYTPGGNDFVNSLQDEDELTGVGDNTVLNANIGGANDGAEAIIAPTLKGIITANVKFSGRADALEGATTGGIDFQDVAGLKTLNVNRITDNAGVVLLQNLQASTDTISVANATRGGVLTFDWREDSLVGLAESLRGNIQDARLSRLELKEGGDSGEDQGYFFENVTLELAGSNNIDTLVISANTREDVTTSGPDQTITLNVKGSTEINSLVGSWDSVTATSNVSTTTVGGVTTTVPVSQTTITTTSLGAEFLNINASSSLVIAQDERNIGLSTNSGITSDQLRKVVITGSGNVTIDGLDLHLQTKSATTGALVPDGTGDAGAYPAEVDASAMTGNLRLYVAAGSSNDGQLNNDLASVAGIDSLEIDGPDIKITSGSGNDVIQTYGDFSGSIITGAGNDAVNITNGGSLTLTAQGRNNIQAVSTIDTALATTRSVQAPYKLLPTLKLLAQLSLELQRPRRFQWVRVMTQ